MPPADPAAVVGGLYALEPVAGRPTPYGERLAGARLTDGVPVELEVLSRALADDDEVRARVRAGSDGLRALNGRHVVRTLHVLVEEPPSGEPLVAVVRDRFAAAVLADARRVEGGTVAPRQAVTTAVEVLAGLAEVHAAGLVHGALSERDVLMDTSVPLRIVVRVTGYGVAALLGRPADVPHAPGATEVPHPADDVWAAGALTGLLLLGAPPTRALLEASGLPAALLSALLPLLADDPPARPTAAQARDALAGLLAAPLLDALPALVPLAPPEPLPAPVPVLPVAAGTTTAGASTEGPAAVGSAPLVLPWPPVLEPPVVVPAPLAAGPVDAPEPADAREPADVPEPVSAVPPVVHQSAVVAEPLPAPGPVVPPEPVVPRVLPAAGSVALTPLDTAPVPAPAWRRTAVLATVAVVAVLALVGAVLAGLGLSSSSPAARPAPAPLERPEPVQPLALPLVERTAYTLARTWSVTSDGARLRGVSIVTNTSDAPLTAEVDEVVPKSVADDVDDLTFTPVYARVLRRDPVVQYDVDRLPPGRSYSWQFDALLDTPVTTAAALAALVDDAEQARAEHERAGAAPARATLLRLAVAPVSLQLRVGETRRLTITGRTSDGRLVPGPRIAGIAVTSSDPRVLQAQGGVVRGRAPGRAVLRVQAGDVRTAATVVVLAPAPPRVLAPPAPAPTTPSARATTAAPRPSTAAPRPQPTTAAPRPRPTTARPAPRPTAVRPTTPRPRPTTAAPRPAPTRTASPRPAPTRTASPRPAPTRTASPRPASPRPSATSPRPRPTF